MGMTQTTNQNLSMGTLPPTPTAGAGDDDSQFTQIGSSPLLSFRQAINLARKMCHDLRPLTKDRKWRFKSYTNCFKAAHAVSWALANINTDDCIAVNRLNQLVDYGLLVHVVDPSKKFRVGETRTLYFRTVNADVFDREKYHHEIDARPFPAVHVKGNPRLTGKFGSNIGSVELDSVQQQIKNVDHISRQTVQESDDTRGQLELLHQEVRQLVSQQIMTFVMLFLMQICIISLSVPSVGIRCFSALGMAVTVIISTRYGWKSISLWSDMDSRLVPMETIVTDDESSFTEGSIVRNAKSFDRTPNARSMASVISKSIRSVTGANLLKKSLSTQDKPIISRDAYSLPDVDTWRHRPILICANTTVTPNLAPDYGAGPIPLGVPFKFSSDLFEGTCLIRLKGSKSDDQDGDQNYFSGRKRIFQSVVQGCFKEEVPVSDVMTGHEFTRPLKNLPHPLY